MKLGQILGLLGGGALGGAAMGAFGNKGFNPLNMLFGASGMAFQPFGGGGGNGLASLFGHGGGGGDDISVTGLGGAGADFLQHGGMGGQPGQQPMNFLGSLSNPQNMRQGGGMPGLTQLTGLQHGMRY